MRIGDCCGFPINIINGLTTLLSFCLILHIMNNNFFSFFGVEFVAII